MQLLLLTHLTSACLVRSAARRGRLLRAPHALDKAPQHDLQAVRDVVVGQRRVLCERPSDVSILVTAIRLRGRVAEAREGGNGVQYADDVVHKLRLARAQLSCAGTQCSTAHAAATMLLRTL